MGNSLIVVEHDEDTIRNADYIVDIGPGAGIHGGHIIAAGTPEEIMKNENSLYAADIEYTIWSLDWLAAAFINYFQKTPLQNLSFML